MHNYSSMDLDMCLLSFQLDGQQNKTMKTSQAFFKQLQDNVSGGSKPTSKKKKKTDHGLSASKILL